MLIKASADSFKSFHIGWHKNDWLDPHMGIIVKNTFLCLDSAIHRDNSTLLTQIHQLSSDNNGQCFTDSKLPLSCAGHCLQSEGWSWSLEKMTFCRYLHMDAGKVKKANRAKSCVINVFHHFCSPRGPFTCTQTKPAQMWLVNGLVFGI